MNLSDLGPRIGFDAGTVQNWIGRKPAHPRSLGQIYKLAKGLNILDDAEKLHKLVTLYDERLLLVPGWQEVFKQYEGHMAFDPNWLAAQNEGLRFEWFIKACCERTVEDPDRPELAQPLGKANLHSYYFRLLLDGGEHRNTAKLAGDEIIKTALDHVAAICVQRAPEGTCSRDYIEALFKLVTPLSQRHSRDWVETIRNCELQKNGATPSLP